jgi:hypothetical protein
VALWKVSRDPCLISGHWASPDASQATMLLRESGTAA